MASQRIQVFEYSELSVGNDGISQEQFDALARYCKYEAKESGDLKDSESVVGKDECPYYSLRNNSIRFRQYVGVLKVGDLIIEVLPKADENGQKDFWYSRLIQMLKCVHKLKIYAPTVAGQSTTSSILDVFIEKFLDQVDELLNKGLVKCYRKENANIGALKGRVLWSKHIVKNCIHKEKFYVNYTTYDYEHVLNRILRKTLEVIPRLAYSTSLRGRAVSSLFSFPELKDIQVSPELFSALNFDRKTEDYMMAIDIAKLILLNYSPDLKDGKNDILALMFDMNKLWEEYIGCILKQKLNGYNVFCQKKKELWKSVEGKKTKTVCADIVIKKDDNVISILDTKWKCPQEQEYASDADLHQMYVYLNRFNVEKVALIYPGERTDVKGYFEGCGKNSCDMIFVSCSGDDWEDNIVNKIGGWLES